MALSTRAIGRTTEDMVRALKLVLKSDTRSSLSHRIGKGVYVWKSTGDFYEGDFANGTRTGFGTLTAKTADGQFQRQYAGGWKNDKKHVCNASSRTLYSTTALQGYGNLFFSDKEHYEGEFYADKRNGWGRMFYADGSTYEGQWLNDQRHGTGMLRLGRTLLIVSPCSPVVIVVICF